MDLLEEYAEIITPGREPSPYEATYDDGIICGISLDQHHIERSKEIIYELGSALGFSKYGRRNIYLTTKEPVADPQRVVRLKIRDTFYEGTILIEQGKYTSSTKDGPYPVWTYLYSTR